MHDEQEPQSDISVGLFDEAGHHLPDAMGLEGVLESSSDQLADALRGVGAWPTDVFQSSASTVAPTCVIELHEVVVVGPGTTEDATVSWKKETFDWLAVHAQEPEASTSAHGNEAVSLTDSRTITHCSQCKYTPSEMSLAQACASCQTCRLQNLATE